MSNHDLEEWLQALPLEVPIDIDGELVCLKVHPEGAELSVLLFQKYTGAQLAEAFRTGFQSALSYDAGLGVTVDDQALLLVQWLPDTSTWADASDALENILNQASMWRAALTQPAAEPDDPSRRGEDRIRKLFSESSR